MIYLRTYYKLYKKYLLNKFNNDAVLSSTQSLNTELLTNQQADLTKNQITKNNQVVVANTEIIIEESTNLSNSDEDNQLYSGASSSSKSLNQKNWSPLI